MERQISVTNSIGSPRTVRVIGYPDQCPRCHSHLVPRLLASVTNSEKPDGSVVEEAFQCTYGQCSYLFIAIYTWRISSVSPPSYDFSRVIPIEPRKPEIGELVTGISPNFYEIYSQALAAEGFGLSQLTGIGLRKALEFLVKDFAVSTAPSKKEEILKKPLANCISDHIDETHVKNVAKRATWLGNDETHYVRKWEDKDIKDLKALIKLTVNGIENVLLAKKYIDEMPEKQPK